MSSSGSPISCPSSTGRRRPTWVAPAGYGFPSSGYAWPVAMDPMMGPVPMEIPAEYVDADAEEPDQVSVSKGALVLDRNDDDIGVVDDVRFEAETGRLQGFVLRVGGALRTLFGGGDTVEVSRSQIESVGESIVKLRSGEGRGGGRRPHGRLGSRRRPSPARQARVQSEQHLPGHLEDFGRVGDVLVDRVRVAEQPVQGVRP